MIYNLGYDPKPRVENELSTMENEKNLRVDLAIAPIAIGGTAIIKQPRAAT